LPLDGYPLRSVVAVVVDGDPQPVEGIRVVGQDAVHPTGWWRHREIEVVYEYGHDTPPVAVANAVEIVAKDFLIGGPFTDRDLQRETADGPIFRSTPGYKGRRFGIPEVDAVIAQHQRPQILVA
jgi:hypothetical protein